MFERRLKVVILVLILFTGVLVLRAGHLQLFNRQYWTERAETVLLRPQLVETIRGRILDFKDRVVAEDVGSTDACVDYRAVIRPPDPTWVEKQATDRLKTRLGDAYSKASFAERKAMRADESVRVVADIDKMWDRLAEISRAQSETRDDAAARIEEIRRSIIARVEMRRRYLWYRNYENALKKFEKRDEDDASMWEKFLIDSSSSEPELDKFAISVAEETDSHAVLRAVDPTIASELGRDAEKYPGLELRPGSHRYYPYAATAAQLIGHLSRVNGDDLKQDPDRGDDLRKYYFNDLVGRTGVEALCEQALRGTRGQVQRRAGDDNILASIPAAAGQDVRLSIDMELQNDVQKLFEAVPIKDFNDQPVKVPMYGAAVVIDVPTGQVRVLASAPSYDLNQFDDRFEELWHDDINRPLLNRATQLALEPGSTVKPVVGLSAITEGLLGTYEGIECTGRLILGGRPMPNGRCWTASRFEKTYPALVPHHQLPTQAPHRGSHGNADGFLMYSDALERSCNVFFETVADRMGTNKLCTWYDRWGLGRKTGIGIPEVAGLLPSKYKGPEARAVTFFAGIGQGYLHATPIQMANAVAAIARSGVWMRPRLVAPTATDPFEPPSDAPDQVDLRVAPDALAEARAGMVRVVSSPGGTGTHLIPKTSALYGRLKVAGKTGTAQAAKFSVVLRKPDGKYDRDENGRLKRQYFEPLTPDNPNGMPWYRGSGMSNTELSHAWYIGFAPADNPKIAFCVFVEYGGSGGVAAAPIATGLLEACVEHGYLSLDAK